MRRLRQKVEVDANRPMHVQTVRGVGYRLVATPGSPAGGGGLGGAGSGPAAGGPAAETPGEGP